MSGQAPGGDSGVRIPPEQTYQEVRRLADGQTRMEMKLDQIHDELRQSRTTLDDHELRLRRVETERVAPATVDDHEVRIRDLESRRLPHSVLNIVAAAVGSAALIWQAIGH